MAATDPPDRRSRPPGERLRFTPGSLVRAVAMLGATITMLGVLAASRRVVGWILVAAAVAGLLHPIVSALARHMRRGLAVLLVVLVGLGGTGAVVYGLVDDLARETRRLQQAAPERARRLEQSTTFGKLARDFKLEDKTRRFVDQIPERLRGGTPAEALLAAGSRGVAFLATTVLMVFFLLHGPRIARSGLRQIRDPTRRAEVGATIAAIYRRAFGYASATLAMAVAAGLAAYDLARWARVPGAAPLGLWVGLWDLVPSVGAFVGAAPIVLLAAVVSGERAAVLTVLFMAYQVVENLLVQRPVEAGTLRLGPFVTLVAALVGFELSGVAGALVFVLGAAVAVAAAEELASATAPAKASAKAPAKASP